MARLPPDPVGRYPPRVSLRFMISVAFLASMSCGDEGIDGPTVLFTGRILEFSLSGPFTEVEDCNLEFPIIPENLTEAVAISLDLELDPAAGQVVTVVEPEDDSNAGVSYELVDPATGTAQSTAFYFSESGVPDPAATSTASSAFGGFPNVAPGEWHLRAEFNERCVIRRGWPGVGADGNPVMRVPVEAGTITSVEWSNCAVP